MTHNQAIATFLFASVGGALKIAGLIVDGPNVNAPAAAGVLSAGGNFFWAIVVCIALAVAGRRMRDCR